MPPGTHNYNLAKIRGADIFITWWGPTLIAHPIVSFDFGEQGHVPMSIETRDEVGQGHSRFADSSVSMP